MAEPVKVGYVVSRWGEPTQTFVRREAAALAARGVQIRVFSLKRPVDTEGLHRYPLHHLRPGAVVSGVVRAVLANPRPVGSLLVTLVRRSASRNVPSQLLAACIGLAWSGHGLLDVDWLHAHFGWVAATAAHAAHGASDVPYSVVLHAFEVHTDALDDGYTRIPLAAAAQVFAISELDAGEVSRRWGVPVAVLRMGVPEEWLEAPVGFDERVRGRVLSVGSLSAKKGHDTAIAALRDLPSDVTLGIVGGGALRSELAALAADLGVDDRVIWYGTMGERAVRELLDEAEVFVLCCRRSPSGDRDGIPVALMEAMARGLPVVTTRLGAIPELVEGAGTLIERDDPRGLAAAISELFDPEVWSRRSVAAHERVTNGFVVEGAIEPLLELLQQQMGRDRAGSWRTPDA